ncbi:MAG: serine/threonine-protein kinase [Verrucomicrobiota bacterium]
MPLCPVCTLAPAGSPPPAETGDRGDDEPRVIGPYRLIEKIGEGGFGVVYRAEQERPLRRAVALKIIKLGMDSKNVVARFEAERQSLAMMDHPGIAKVFDGGTTDRGRPYFAMELVRGVPITEYCDKNRLAPRERLKLIIALCSAIEHAHSCGIVHRDIKPSNVLIALVDGRPAPKVIDFGVAKALTGQNLGETAHYTKSVEMLGTPAYMSPEQAEMTGLEIDARADVYSLGVLLYELLAGVTPYDEARLRAASLGEVQRILNEEDPPPASWRFTALGSQTTQISHKRRIEPIKLRRLLKGDLDWILMKALERDRTRRYDSPR